SRPSVGPVQSRCLQFLGADSYVTESRGALLAPGHERSGMQTLWKSLHAEADDWDWVLWAGVHDSHLAYLPPTPRLINQETSPNYTLQLPASWEALQGRFRRNLKESLRKCYNSLKRAGLSFELEVAREGKALEDALTRFFALHAARASLKNT